MSNVVHSMIGLPASGKTTFLAALWHVLNANEIDSSFSLEKIVGNVTYLNLISECWRTFKIVPRTPMQMEQQVSLYVKNNTTQESVILEFPDLSGETFEKQLRTRSLDENKLNHFLSSDGILLFVTANKIQDGISILDVPPEVREEKEVEIGLVDAKPWDPESVPLQVKVVELLQFVQSLSSGQSPRKVAVIVSAWDVISNFSPKTKPLDWLRREMPLLSQFLSNNLESFQYCVFGVSAQGGDINSEDDKNHLSEIMEASKRIQCIGNDIVSHDITSPILWLMSRE